MKNLPSALGGKRVLAVWGIACVICVVCLIASRAAYAQTDNPPPEGDITIITQDDAAVLMQQDGVKNPDPNPDDELMRQRQLAENEAIVRSFFDRHPDVARRIPLVDPNEEATSPTGDGNFMFAFMDELGMPHNVVTMGREFWFGELASGIQNFPAKANQVTLYRQLYRLAQTHKAPGLAPGRFPSIRRINNFSALNVKLLNDRLARKLYAVRYQFKIPIELGPLSCDEEAGFSEGRDEDIPGCGYSAAGVFQNYNWPLKPYLTCVKDQAARGTCVSFAIDGGLETTIAKTYHRWINLSEQDLYYRAAGLWYPRFYGDGLWSEGVMGNLIDRSYKVPYEGQWNYNPSWSRQELPAAAPDHYENSCDGYDGAQELFCSDTAHQGQRFCFPGILNWLCFSLPAPESMPSPYTLTSKVQLWDVSNPDLSFVKVILTLALGQRPVVLDIPVYTSWDHVDGNGYVHGSGGPLCAPDPDGKCRVKTGCECNRGGHAVLIVGFIDNERLPAGAPQGAGGGYFIIKNSWGTCFADGGYIYVPYQWVKNLAGSAVSVTTVSNS